MKLSTSAGTKSLTTWSNLTTAPLPYHCDGQKCYRYKGKSKANSKRKLVKPLLAFKPTIITEALISNIGQKVHPTYTYDFKLNMTCNSAASATYDCGYKSKSEAG